MKKQKGGAPAPDAPPLDPPLQCYTLFQNLACEITMDRSLKSTCPDNRKSCLGEKFSTLDRAKY